MKLLLFPWAWPERGHVIPLRGRGGPVIRYMRCFWNTGWADPWSCVAARCPDVQWGPTLACELGSWLLTIRQFIPLMKLCSLNSAEQSEREDGGGTGWQPCLSWANFFCSGTQREGSGGRGSGGGATGGASDVISLDARLFVAHLCLGKRCTGREAGWLERNNSMWRAVVLDRVNVRREMGGVRMGRGKWRERKGGKEGGRLGVWTEVGGDREGGGRGERENNSFKSVFILSGQG